MNTFTRKALYAAIAGVAAVGVASTAQAVNLSADGLGQVLIYPYYTVKANSSGLPYNTLLSVVNTTSSVKAVKVRFREGKNSVEVLDFNLFLSPYDVWTATITPGPIISGADPATAGAQITTTDKSCTIPAFTSGVPVQFRAVAINDGDVTLSRTAEGYFEMFEMATETGVTAAKATHVGGVPACGITDAGAALDARPPSGGLFGGLIIVNPAGGGAFAQAATALQNWKAAGAYSPQGQGGTLAPQYGDGDPLSNVIQGSTLYSTVWPGLNGGNNAVTAVLLGNSVTNEYVLDAGTKSQTSWIVTMPTKYVYVNSIVAIPPFTSKYTALTGACEPTFGVVFDREESAPQIVTNSDFSPPVPGQPGPTLCYEVNSINFNNNGVPANGNVFGSALSRSLNTEGRSNGWTTFGFNDLGIISAAGLPTHSMSPGAGATIQFDLIAGTTSTSTVTYFGLPVIGFAAETFQNDALTINGKAFLSTFGAPFVHHKTSKIQ